jgi:hypothetical protein
MKNDGDGDDDDDRVGGGETTSGTAATNGPIVHPQGVI